MKNFKKREKLKNKLNLKKNLWINLLLVLKKTQQKIWVKISQMNKKFTKKKLENNEIYNQKKVMKIVTIRF